MAKNTEERHYEDVRGAFIIRFSKKYNKRIKIYTENWTDKQLGKKIRDSLKKIGSKEFEDGTYDVNTQRLVELSDGFQASFQRTSDDYSDEEFGKLIRRFANSSDTDGKIYAGKFEGDPEPSFCFKTKEAAMQVCKEFNQYSMWDNQEQCPIGNPDYVKDGTNDYD